MERTFFEIWFIKWVIASVAGSLVGEERRGEEKGRGEGKEKQAVLPGLFFSPYTISYIGYGLSFSFSPVDKSYQITNLGYTIIYSYQNVF